MAFIFPFAALRPVPQVAASVAAVPYDVVNAHEARALAADNPLSFLHISRAEIDLPPSTDPYSDVVYERATENFRDLRARAPLVEEDTHAFYAYQLQMGEHVQTGIAACFSLDEYENGVIKKHEKTRPEKEDDRTRHMLAIGAQTGPVLLTYTASTAIDAILSRTVAREPLFDFVAPDDVRHVVWTIEPAAHEGVIRTFELIPALYIADGHHRAASAARARRALAGRGPGEHDRVLAVAFPDNQMQILPYNRIVKDLRGMSESDFLAALGRHAHVNGETNQSIPPKGHAAMYLGGRWFDLEMRPGHGRDQAAALDVSVLQDTVLEPVLGITDVRTDRRIDFVGGIRGTKELERLVDSGDWAVAFSLHPVTVRNLMDIADAGGIMPPKSTWFEPKLRDGLLSHLI